MYYVYFIKSNKNKKIYTGITSKNPKIRLEEHNKGCNSWSRQNGPFMLLYYEKYYCKTDVMQREKFYKSGYGRIIRNAILSTVSARGGPAFGGG